MQLSHNTSLELTGESRAATDRPQLILCFTVVAQFRRYAVLGENNETRSKRSK